MAISHVNTQGASIDGDTLTVTKPTGTAENDLLIMFFTSNNQVVSPPSGWTEIADDVVEVFRHHVFYKVAGGSEPANYAFTTPNATLLIGSIVCLRGIDTTDPIDIAPGVETATTHSEPYTTPSVSGGSSGRLLYYRQCRNATATVITYSVGAGPTELDDRGIDDGTVAYSHAVYLAASDYATTGTQTGLAITASTTEAQNIVTTLGVKVAAIPGTMQLDLLLPTMDTAGLADTPGTMEVDLLLPEMTGDGISGNTEGDLDAEVPISMEAEMAVAAGGTLDTIILPTMELFGETRYFSENVVSIDRDERWLIMTQDGYRDGIRNIFYIPAITIELPSLQLQFTGQVDAAGATVFADVVANGATVFVESNVSAETASVSVTANNATISFITPLSPDAGTATVTVTANQPTVSAINQTRASAGHVSVTCHN